jgi:hypothetical protein
MAGEFDASEAVTFDLAYGHIHLDGAPTRVMVPAGALVALCQAAGDDETATLGHAIGEAMGRRVAVRLSGGSDDRRDAVRRAGLEKVVEHLSGEFALLGFGALAAERWGRALVFVIDQSPLGEEGDGLLGEILQAAVHAFAGQHGRVLKLHREGVRARFLVISGAAVEGVRERLQRGESWGSVLAALHQGGLKA